MSKEIINLEPKGLWKSFYDITQIPHPSKHEKKLADFVKKFGEDLELETTVDEISDLVENIQFKLPKALSAP